MKQFLLHGALAQNFEGSWRGSRTPPNWNGGIRFAFQIEDMFTAFQEQLGLKLNTTNALADVLVIDNV